MKIVYNSRTGPYLVETETGFIYDVPEKCKTCNNIKKMVKGCMVDECDLDEYDVD